MTVYEMTLFAHSSLRWVVVLTSLFLCIRSFLAWRSKRNWEQADERLHVIAIASFDAQLTLGLLLYVFLSPLSWAFFADLPNTLKDPILRFFGMEHTIAMFVATAVIHLGRVRSRRAATTNLRHRYVWMTTLFALVIIAAALPWPGLRHGRPFLRGLTSVG